MNEKISVHDNRILGYEVDAINKSIIIKTDYGDSGNDEQTDIIFEGVLAYHFEGDLFRSIIFDVEEIDSESAIPSDLLERKKNCGWPQGWDSKSESIGAYITRLNLKAFGIQSSYGLNGFVIAETMTKKIANQKVEPTVKTPVE